MPLFNPAQAVAGTQAEMNRRAALPPASQEWERQMRNVAPRSRAGRAESEIYLGPQAIANDTNELFRLLASSPMFANILRGISQQGSQLNTGIQSAIGRTGLAGSGIGAATSGLASSVTGNAMAGAQGDLFRQALETALQALTSRLQMAPTLSESRRAGPSVLESIGSGIGRVGGALPGAGTVINAIRRPRSEN